MEECVLSWDQREIIWEQGRFLREVEFDCRGLESGVTFVQVE